MHHVSNFSYDIHPTNMQNLIRSILENESIRLSIDNFGGQ